MREPRTVTPQQLQACIQDGEELALLDVREAGQFGESHLLFAVPLPYSRLELVVGGLVPRKTVRIVLCDGSDGIASQAAERLAALGYTDVSVLAGGIRAWANAGCTALRRRQRAEQDSSASSSSTSTTRRA